MERLAAALKDRYRVERELGRGGMATVYLAHDLKHDRDVAIKVLHPELGAALGGERFLAEIKTTAKLQHPHILPLLDSGDADGLLFYVMPLVEGETLRARLERERQLPVDDAVRIATETAGALDYAHRHGVIHRDIKPENILLHDGRAVVADFGIALAVSAASGPRMTQTGLSLGTPQYMSPEQAMGEKQVDARADVYALGAVTYEMLTGEPPFTGPTVQAIVAKVMADSARPPIELRRAIPANVSAAVLHALEKLPADRFATAAAFATALATPGFVAPAGSQTATRSGMRRLWTALPRRARTAVAASGVLVAASLGLVWAMSNSVNSADTIRLTIDAPPGTRFDAINWATPAVTADGRAVVFAARGADGSQLYVRHLGDYEAHLMKGTQELSPSLSISPDGQWVTTLTIGAELVKVPVAGNALMTVLGTQQDWFGGGQAWLADTLVVSAFPNLVVARPSTGGTERVITRADTARGEREFFTALAMTDGTLLTSVSTDSGIRTAIVTSERGRTWISGLERAAIVAVVPPATIIGMQDGRYFAGTLDTRSGRFSDRHDIALDAPTSTRISVGGSGTVAYFHLEPGHGRRLVWVDRRGAASPLPAASGQYRAPRLSPDGGRVAVYGATADGKFAVMVIDARTGSLTRMVAPDYSTNPVWDASGKTIAFATGAELPQRTVRQNADGSGAILPAYTTPFRSSPIWALRDGSYLAEALNGTQDLYAINSGGDVRVVIGGPRAQRLPSISPDGRWIAYMSNETGRFEVYVQPWPTLDHKWTISTNGGAEPLWSHDGRELYFRRGPEMRVSHITTSPAFQASRPEVLFDAGRFAIDPFGDLSYDVAADGRFLMIEDDPDARVELRVELNALRERPKRPSAAGSKDTRP